MTPVFSETLTGFSFVLDYRAGNVAFDAMFTNPADPTNPVIYQGETNSSNAAPESSMFLLFGVGLGGLLFMKLSRKCLKCSSLQ